MSGEKNQHATGNDVVAELGELRRVVVVAELLLHEIVKRNSESILIKFFFHNIIY